MGFIGVVAVSSPVSDNIIAIVNNSITLIYYPALVRSCLAIVATVIPAAFPVHVTDAAEIDEAHLVDGLMPSAFLLAIALANQSPCEQRDALCVGSIPIWRIFFKVDKQRVPYVTPALQRVPLRFNYSFESIVLLVCSLKGCYTYVPMP